MKKKHTIHLSFSGANFLTVCGLTLDEMVADEGTWLPLNKWPPEDNKYHKVRGPGITCVRCDTRKELAVITLTEL